MVPTEELFNRYPRAVRDMAKKQKKKINLLVEGEDTEMDRVMIESLTDPVMHLVRNAVDHGIELPKTRKENDKNEDGIILLKARRDKNQVVIEVQDDGKGIDPEEIKKSIVRKKLAKKADVNKLSDDEVLDYIFHPGFTTKRAASRVSGRGVGLDVVMEEIQKLRGDIRVSSTPDKGTIFSIRLPLTVAITQALLVRVRGESLAIPINSIEETLDYDAKSIVSKDNKDFLKVRSAEIPLVKLTDFVKYDSEPAGEEAAENVIIIKDGTVKYGLVVDRALRREEIVVRSLGQELADLDNVAGGTIFGDGTVVLIVDIPAITRKIEADFFGEERDFSSLETARDLLDGKTQKPKTSKKRTTAAKKTSIKGTRKKVEQRKPAALIIDDSLSVRKFVSSVLERNNYTTVLAEDGPEALEELKATEFDIIITDLEMPKMQGFELIEKVRAQDKLKDVPIVILTGKAAKENKEKGLSLGANAYIVKPFKENDLLKTLAEFIQV
jgi:CheY-like chemotaxis protein